MKRGPKASESTKQSVASAASGKGGKAAPAKTTAAPAASTKTQGTTSAKRSTAASAGDKPKAGSTKIPQSGGTVSSGLPKDWKEIEKNVFLCAGTCSQAHKKFRARNQQSAANCIVACAFAALWKMNTWTKEMLDYILQIGTDLHLKSKLMSTNRCLEHMKPSQIYNYFFLKDLKISMRIGVDVTHARITRDSAMLQHIEEMIMEFFQKQHSGVLAYVHTYFAIWKDDRHLYIFDPTEHNLEGGKWTGLPGMGYCYCIRSNNSKILADVVVKNCPLKYINRFSIYPCNLDKYIVINTKPPNSLQEVEAVPLEVSKVVKKSILEEPKKPAKTKKEEPPAKAEEAPPAEGADEQPQAEKPKEEPKKEVPKSRIPPGRPKLGSVTHFSVLLQGRMGILRASTHQRDPNFTRYMGKQSMGNAIAALTMLRQYRSKQWVRNILDDILRLGEQIHHDMKKLPSGQVIQKVTLYELSYTPKIEKYGSMGVIESSDDTILDLKQALTNALIDMDCCILCGPNVVAIWKEESKYYMFDPEERNAVGKPVEVGETGVACLTWYSRLSDLMAIYINNLPKDQKKGRFAICKVAIKDYIQRPEDWFNFKSLAAVNKWILRGTFHQGDRRFSAESRNTQCTANSAMALTYKQIKEEKDWDSQTMDQILTNGDELYRNTVEHLQAIGKFGHPHLMADELLRNFTVENKKVNLEIEDCLVYGVINAKGDASVLNLLQGFSVFFEENDSGIFTAKALSMAVWKRDDIYYYFDSHCRDQKGLVSLYGTSCVIRTTTVEDLAKSVMVNLGSDLTNIFNISRVVAKIFDVTDEGLRVPPLNFFEAVNSLIAILRSNTSQKDKKYDISAGKQQVPMCLAALAFNTITPSSEWTKEDVDQVLNIGNKLYEDSMAANYAQDVPQELNVDDVTTANVKKQLSIGPNSIEIELEDNAFGNLENLKEAIESLHARSEAEGKEVFRSILESQYMVASMWRDEDLYYLFDPCPRDEKGSIYGKDDWSVKMEVVDDKGEEEGEEMEYGEEEVEEGENDDYWQTDYDKDEGGGGDNMGEPTDEEEKPPEEVKIEEEPPQEDVDDERVADEEQEGEDEQTEEEKAPVIEKKGSAYWHQKEEEGKACVLRFGRLEDLIQHILDNSPPNHRQEIDFSMKNAKLKNTPILHEVFDPEEDEKKDEFVGDWNEFKEFDYGRWILRGRRNLTDGLYPINNRGKQALPMCLVSLAFSTFYSLSKFNQDVVDLILAYGDRLHSCLLRQRDKELKSNRELGLTEEEIEQILNHTKFEMADYPRNICMDEMRTHWEPQLEVVQGEIASQIPENIPDLMTALNMFFDSAAVETNKPETKEPRGSEAKRASESQTGGSGSTGRLGILICRDYPVAIFKNEGMFFMFDPHANGPSGTKSPMGVSCITRFKALEHLVETYKTNLPKIGDNYFAIHAFTFTKEACVRPRAPECVKEEAPKMGGFKEITAGKSILRGDVKLDCTKFDRGVHIHSAPIAFVALALSLNKDPETWTRMIINEILTVGECLYNETLEKLGEKFDPWSKQMDICKVNTDFMIGRLKVNVAIRFTEQRGIVDIKNSKTPNLRQGIERFFDENTHGVLVADKFILGIWEHAGKDKTTNIFVFDPNSRGGTGLPGQGGVPCLMKFCNAKVASDHIMACMMDIDKSKTEFAIVPVEIVVQVVRKNTQICKDLHKEKKPEKTSTTCHACCDPNWEYARAQKPITSTTVTTKRPTTSQKAATCPDQTAILEQKRVLRRIAAEAREREEKKKCELLGRTEMYEISSNQSIIRGRRSLVKDRDLPVNLVAFVFMKIAADLSKWNYRQIELILEAGSQLYMDSYNAYKPPTTKLGIQHVLRRIIIKDFEAKFDIKKPLPGGRFNRETLNTHLTNFFMITNFCIVSFDEFLVSVYFKSGYYYLFDPYSRDLMGNPTDDGSAMLMRFGDLSELVDKVVKNLGSSDQTEKKYALIVVGLSSVTPIAR